MGIFVAVWAWTRRYITGYEVVRGLKAKAATRQLQQFATFSRHCQILPVCDAIFERAADLWAISEAVAQGWREVRVDTDAVRRIMEERREAIQRMLAYLNAWPHV